MEPRIQYAQTADGVSIAFWTRGKGEPFVCMPNVPWSHVELEWQTPELRRWFERLAEKRTVVRYDNRGSGLSDREVTDYSLDAQVLDLEAVINRLGLETFALMGPLHSGPVAIAYATRHPERVSHLLLWCTYARGPDYYGSSPQLQATRVLLDHDWEVYTETVAHVAYGWSAGEEARRFASFIRRSVSREAVQATREAIETYDVTALLPKVKAPTLVLHRRQFSLPRLEVARRLASQIPDARLVILEGASPAPFLDDTESVLKAIGEFLGVELQAEPAAGSGGQAPVTILFTDMEGSTSVTQCHGDAKAQEILRTHNTIIREALNAHGGLEIKHTGDGIMASFASASRAIASAVAMQKGFAAHNEVNPETPIRVRIGLNAGEPVAEEDDLFGTAVQLAARICAHAQPGEILVSNVVRDLAAGKGFLFADQGEVVLRGFEDPLRLYEVGWREDE
jgi:class 3 adenylate cyclase/pimeloyl-ACP methyl ester carboxylesterase